MLTLVCIVMSLASYAAFGLLTLASGPRLSEDERTMGALMMTLLLSLAIALDGLGTYFASVFGGLAPAGRIVPP